MSLRYVQVTADARLSERLRAIADEASSIIHHRLSTDDNDQRTLTMLVGPEDQQALLDRIQASLGAQNGWRIVVMPVEATIPQPEPDPQVQERKAKASTVQTREELYHDVEHGARANRNFVLLTVLSTIVAVIGLTEDNVAVVIGAMVIAPLLGPNLALILGIALGDRDLIWRAVRTNGLGVGLTFALAVVIGLILPINTGSGELLARTAVGVDGLVLALSSGAAAALSLTTGLSGTLVGVMVAVALMPPAAAVGLTLAAGEVSLALRAALLLAANVVCVNLAGQVVFLLQGVAPRTWLEQHAARQSVKFSIAFWAVCLIVLVALVLVWGQGAEPLLPDS